MGDERRPGLIPKRRQGPYRTDRCADTAPDALLEGIAQFNAGLYFEQHETLEELWRSEPDDVRYLYHGILLVGVGLYHLKRGNFPGAVAKLEGGLDKLRWFEPSCQGVDVAALVRDSSLCLALLRKAGPNGLRDFDWSAAPKIQLARSST